MQSNCRFGQIDGMRGAAIVLMVIDHVLLVFDGDGWARHSITRVALPLFMVCSGALWERRGVVVSRVRGILVVGVCVSAAGLLVGWPQPDVLVVYALVASLAWLCVRWPIAAMLAGFLQYSEWPLPWTGYQPGLLLLWAAVGVLASRRLWLLSCPESGWLCWIGRRPLTVYCLHLAVIFGWVIGSAQMGGRSEGGSDTTGTPVSRGEAGRPASTLYHPSAERRTPSAVFPY